MSDALEIALAAIDIVFGDEPDWPHGRCVDASRTLCEALETVHPEMGATLVWGRALSIRDGGDWMPHAWVALADGTIADPTAGQFEGGPAWRIISPDDVVQGWYDAQAVGDEEIMSVLAADLSWTGVPCDEVAA